MTNDDSIYLLDLPPSQWRAALAAAGVEPYRGDQMARWVFERSVFDLADMTDLPRRLRQELPGRLRTAPPTVDRRYTSVDASRRYLLSIAGGGLVEAVYMPVGSRLTFCISSQVGCRFACSFCQTGRLGLSRSLSPGEIVGQVLRLRAEAETDRPRFNVVFMGQGEPLDDVDSVVDATLSLQDPRGLGMSWRRITVSTVGLVPGIERLATMGPARPRIAVSLNATTDEARSELMPVNRKYPIAALLDALRRIPWRHREQVTFEYVMLRGVNDTRQDAERLVRLLRGLPAKVNLIPWNPIETMAFQRPSPGTIERFRRWARSGGLDVLVRYSRGADIGAACGQLSATGC